MLVEFKWEPFATKWKKGHRWAIKEPPMDFGPGEKKSVRRAAELQVPDAERALPEGRPGWVGLGGVRWGGGGVGVGGGVWWGGEGWGGWGVGGWNPLKTLIEQEFFGKDQGIGSRHGFLLGFCLGVPVCSLQYAHPSTQFIAAHVHRENRTTKCWKPFQMSHSERGVGSWLETAI